MILTATIFLRRTEGISMTAAASDRGMSDILERRAVRFDATTLLINLINFSD
jgi:hypothetical protein